MYMHYVGRHTRVPFYSFEVIFSLEGDSTERVTSAILLYSVLKIREREYNQKGCKGFK